MYHHEFKNEDAAHFNKDLKFEDNGGPSRNDTI